LHDLDLLSQSRDIVLYTSRRSRYFSLQVTKE
jgi:hypothetical protein